MANDDRSQWPAGWDGHTRAQRRRMAGLPLSEKLAWLEEAQRVAASLAASRPCPVPSDGDARNDAGAATDDGSLATP